MSNRVRLPCVKIGRVLISYRGMFARPFFRFRKARIGTSRLYYIGPISIFLDYVR